MKTGYFAQVLIQSPITKKIIASDRWHLVKNNNNFRHWGRRARRCCGIVNKWKFKITYLNFKLNTKIHYFPWILELHSRHSLLNSTLCFQWVRKMINVIRLLEFYLFTAYFVSALMRQWEFANKTAPRRIKIIILCEWFYERMCEWMCWWHTNRKPFNVNEFR